MKPTVLPLPPTAGARSKKGLASRLETIPGVGPARRKALLGKFGSIEGILNASIAEIVEIPGITPDLAQAIKTGLE